jgi:hypothetical protein
MKAMIPIFHSGYLLHYCRCSVLRFWEIHGLSTSEFCVYTLSARRSKGVGRRLNGEAAAPTSRGLEYLSIVGTIRIPFSFSNFELYVRRSQQHRINGEQIMFQMRVEE